MKLTTYFKGGGITLSNHKDLLDWQTEFDQCNPKKPYVYPNGQINPNFTFRDNERYSTKLNKQHSFFVSLCPMPEKAAEVPQYIEAVLEIESSDDVVMHKCYHEDNTFSDASEFYLETNGTQVIGFFNEPCVIEEKDLSPGVYDAIKSFVKIRFNTTNFTVVMHM